MTLRSLQNLLLLGLVIAVALLNLVVFSALGYAHSDHLIPKADAIFVLGAGMDEDGTLHASTLGRVKAGVALYHAGHAPLIVMTGGRLIEGAPAAGEQMAQAAISLGVPASAVRVEANSHSTLQNGLMSKPILDAEGVSSVILVTEGFHMARSLAVMRWVGIEVIAVKASSAFRDTLVSSLRMVIREVLAWGFNILRVMTWHMLGWIGWSTEQRMAMLA